MAVQFESVTAGATSVMVDVFIEDSTATYSEGLTGLVFNSASLTAYYHRDTASSATAITLVTATVGTFTSSGFKEIDSTNMPGWYQLGIPNAALAAGASSVAIHLKGATDMANATVKIQLRPAPANLMQVESATDHAELSALPDTTPSLLEMVQFVYQFLRNKATSTNSLHTLYKNDSSTSLGTAAIADDNTTFSRNRIA